MKKYINKSYKIVFIVVFILLIFPQENFGQNKIDSLRYIIDTAKQDTIKIKALLSIGTDIYHSNIDSAISVFNEALSLSKKQNYDNGKIEAYMWLGYLYNSKGQSDTALKYYHQALEMLEPFPKKNYKRLVTLLNNIAYINDLRGNIPVAIEYYTKALKLSEENTDSSKMSILLNNLSTIYYALGDTVKAVEYIDKVYEIQKKTGDKKGLANTLRLYGEIAFRKKQFDKAMEFYQQSYSMSEEDNSYNSMGVTLLKIGNIFLEKKEYDSAIVYFNKALFYQQQIKSPKGIIPALYKIAEVYYNQNKLELSKQYAEKSLKLAQEIGYPLRILDAASLLANIYKKQKKWKLAYEMFELKVKMRDSVLNIENQKLAMKQQMQYEYEKKLAMDSIAFVKEIKIRDLETNKARIQRNYSILGLLVILAFLFIIFRSYKQKQKANLLLQKQKIEIQLQRDNLKKANEIISKNHKRITDSINYASRIQAALLPSQNLFKNDFSDFFIFYKPKDIVSGDFYYLKNIKNYIIIAAADCTGHGVPGAFVSMLGVAFLNEIIRKEKIQTAADILEELRIEFKNSLNKNNKENQTDDGMDIALSVINTNTNELQFAGAYNPLYIMRNRELSVIEGTNSPIGIYLKEKKFKNNVIQLQKDDILYMFSDGYIDQLGGEKKRKFTQKRFKELIISMEDIPLPKQAEKLDKVLEDWKSGYQQIDDILIIGVKI